MIEKAGSAYCAPPFSTPKGNTTFKKIIMQKHLFIILALFVATQLGEAATVTAPADIPAYYTSVNGKSGNSLYTTLNTVTNKGFKSLGYDGAISAYQKSDVYPADSVGKAGKLWDMYGACSFSLGDECGNYKRECDCYNREHSIPKSWWGGGKNPMYSDIFHLVPTDGYVNNRRSAYAFGEVKNATYTFNDCKLGSSVSSVSTDRETIRGKSATCSGTVFEPRNEYKGDFARGYLGMIAKYSNSSYSITSGDGGKIFESFSSSSHYALTQYGVVLLMKWHREDPVSQKEIDRNNGIQETQGNRNPFIDYPYLAEYIWGEKAGEPVDLAKLMPSTDKDFIPGVSNGWRDGSPVDPEKPVVKYGVTWSVNGEEIQTDSIEENKKITTLPDEPVSCSAESDVFMGWTTAPIIETLDEAPAVLYVALQDFPAVTEDVVYYAVFAKETVEEGAAPAVYTFNADSQDGWTNTASKNGDYWLLDAGKALTSPVVDLSGLSTIQIKMRTYGGTQYDKLQVAAGDKFLTTIEAAKGSAMTDYDWTNTQSLSGKSALTFTCSNADSKKGIGFQSVTINATGAGTTYSRYITTCQTTTEVETLTDKKGLPVRKILVGGQLYILQGQQLFTITGQRVK